MCRLNAPTVALLQQSVRIYNAKYEAHSPLESKRCLRFCVAF